MPTSITGQGISIYPAPDDALSSTSKNPVQNKVIDEELSDVKNAISQKQDAPSSAGTADQVLGLDSNLNPVWVDQTGGSGLTEAIKTALLSCFEHVAWVNSQGANYYNALRIALYGGILPPEYQQVAYISTESTGPYINTGFIPTSNDALIVDFRFAYNPSSYAFGIAGHTGGTNSRYAFGMDASSGHPNVWYCGIGDTNTWNGVSDTVRHVFSVDALNKKFTVDDDNYDVSFTDFSTSASVILFARQTNVGVLNKCVGELYRATIKRSGDIVHDYIPCYRISDNTPGLYDIIDNVFLTNSGDGSFAIGDSV